MTSRAQRFLQSIRKEIPTRSSVAAIFSIALGTLVGWSVLETIRTRLRR